MIRIHQLNLQPIVGGGEVYTRSFTRALADAGAHVSLYVNSANRFWDDLAGARIERIAVPDEAEFLARLPSQRAIVLTQSSLSPGAIQAIAARHVLTGFAHLPMYQRSAAGFQAYRLVFTVSRYCIGLLQQAVGRQIAALSPEARAGLANAPYLLADAGFDNPLRWQGLARWRVEDLPREAASNAFVATSAEIDLAGHDIRQVVDRVEEVPLPHLVKLSQRGRIGFDAEEVRHRNAAQICGLGSAHARLLLSE